MSMRGGRGGSGSSATMRGGGGDRRDDSLEAPPPNELEQQGAMGGDDDDDNAQPDLSLLDQEGGEEQQQQMLHEDPLLLALDDLEGRVVAAIDDVKLHPGVKTASGGGGTVHEELAVLLRPVVEVAAHTGPSVARTYYNRDPDQGGGGGGIEASMEEAYERTVSDLVLPVMLEMAQSDTVPAKRTASLEFFRTLWKECHKAGSWLDNTTTGPQAGPYGPGGGHSGSGSGGATAAATTPAMRVMLKRRQQKRLIREGEILRYWVEASVACLVAGVFTAADAEGAVASRGIIAASAAIRPSLRHISQRIRDADDRGAVRLFNPVMKMVGGVLRKLFLETSSTESVRAACIKFLEIVILCFSHKPKDVSSRRRGAQSTNEGFALDDLPTGHPTITREILESIAEYAFTTLRGMTMMGGQVKIDVNTLGDMLLGGGGNSASQQVVSILKPAGLAYLELESSVPVGEDGGGGDDSLEFEIDRSNVEFDFLLSQKSYALTINAMSALALHRPVFFKESATCLARRAAKPPEFAEGGPLTKSAVLVVASQLRASCLTLLRNDASITSGTSTVLHKALKTLDMEIQADKALKTAKQTILLKNSTRKERNRANMYYEWDPSESDRRSEKRQRETDTELAKLRAAKKARGLGHGIQLPTSMTDSVELILSNLSHLPAKRPEKTSSSSKTRMTPITLDYLIDAVMTNGASLLQEDGRWYDKGGGNAWDIDLSENPVYKIDPKLAETLEVVKENAEASTTKKDRECEERKKLFFDQCNSAAADAVERILSRSFNSRSKHVGKLGKQLAARLAFTLKGAQPQPTGQYKLSLDMARESVRSYPEASGSKDLIKSLQAFVDEYPLVATSFALPAASRADTGDASTSEYSLNESLMNEALLQSSSHGGAHGQFHAYDNSLDLFVACTVHAGELANDKPADLDRKRAATQSAAVLQRDFVTLPRLTERSLILISAMCDIGDITKKAREAAQKKTQESIAAAAAAHVAKVAAEKRATSVLLILRDVAFQREHDVRKFAVCCATGLASGRLPSGSDIPNKALKLVVNVLFSKSELLSDLVVDAALADLQWAKDFAVEQFKNIKIANKEAEKKSEFKNPNPLSPQSDTEKQVLERMRKPAVLIMALCVRRPEMIKTLFSVSCEAKADALSKAVRANMSMLTRAVAAKHGAATIALQVAAETSMKDASMLLSFLENLAPSNERTLPDQEVIDACFKIQATKLDGNGKKDPRYLVPVVSAMKRKDLVERLPEFVAAEDKVFLAGLVRMGDRVGRQALLFRDEPDEDNPSLHGMTLCEQLVYLHKLDFSAAGLPQKRYLAAIKLCLDEDEVYNDNVLMAALDEMSGKFLMGEESLPLAFMRTNILICTKHETLHSWICHTLLPRLVEGKIWNDARQWEGWMRCAHMLEESDDPNVNSVKAIEKLPPEQLLQYRTKWAK